MSSATPSRPASPPWGAILGAGARRRHRDRRRAVASHSKRRDVRVRRMDARERRRLVAEARAREPAAAGLPASLDGGAHLRRTQDLGLGAVAARARTWSARGASCSRSPTSSSSSSRSRSSRRAPTRACSSWRRWFPSCWRFPPGRSSPSLTAGRSATSTSASSISSPISSLGVYGIIMAGWASNSKYPLMSALRAAAQMVSYEVSIGFVIVTVVMCAGSLNLTDIVRAQDTRLGVLGWYWLPLLPMFVIFFVSALAETNRPPFDLDRGGIGACRRLFGRIFGLAVPAAVPHRTCRAS